VDGTRLEKINGQYLISVIFADLKIAAKMYLFPSSTKSDSISKRYLRWLRYRPLDSMPARFRLAALLSSLILYRNNISESELSKSTG
jgi:hypothetical protein